MITTLLQLLHSNTSGIGQSKLFDEQTFYPKFMRDIEKAGAEIVIESPFITSKRLNCLLPALRSAKSKRVRVAINTRDPQEHNEAMRVDALKAISQLQHVGIQVIFTKRHHRKVAIIDRKILYEGSLNILSQNNSREFMRRFESRSMAWQIIRFAKLDNLIS